MAKHGLGDYWGFLFRKVSYKERVFVARQMAVMIEAGLPIVQAIRTLEIQTQNPVMRQILAVILRDLENGYRLSDALRKHPEVFDEVFCAVTASGEATGKLENALRMLADGMERDNNARGRAIGSLIYPGFIVGAMIVVGIIMVTRIVPALETVFKESNVSLPWTTRTVVAVTDSLMHYWYVYILVLALLVYGLTRYWASPPGRRQLNSWMIHLPVVGKIIANVEMMRFTRILAMMIDAGVPIIQALDSVARVMDNLVYREALLTLARNVERGATISQTLAKYEEFPATVVETIGVGEQTGKLDQVLYKLSDYYDNETNQAVKNLSSLMEPVVFVIVGLGVAFLVFSVIVPIYNLASVIQ